MGQIIIALKELPRVQKFSSFDDVCLWVRWRSCVLLEQSQDLGMVVFGIGFALLPDGLESPVLDPADLDDAGGASCRVALECDVLAQVFR